MKKIFIIIGIFIFILFVGAIVYCIPNKAIREIYDDLMKIDSSYSELKEQYDGVQYKEYAIHDKIIIKAKTGTYRRTFQFQLDKDYLIFKTNEDLSAEGLEYYYCIIDIFANRYGIDKELVHMYLNHIIDV